MTDAVVDPRTVSVHLIKSMSIAVTYLVDAHATLTTMMSANRSVGDFT